MAFCDSGLVELGDWVQKAIRSHDQEQYFKICQRSLWHQYEFLHMTIEP
jgi:hypothetical protein